MKPWKEDDVDEAKQILRTFLADDEEEEEDDEEDDDDPETAFLTPKQRAVVREYGGWMNFCIAFGLRPWKDPGEVDEALQIIDTLLSDEADGDDDDSDGYAEGDLDDVDSEIEWLNPEQKKVVKAWGGWTNFLFSFGLRPWNPEDIDEALNIIDCMLSEYEEGDSDDDEFEKNDQQKEVKKGEQEKQKAEQKDNKLGEQKGNRAGEQAQNETAQKKRSNKNRGKTRKGGQKS